MNFELNEDNKLIQNMARDFAREQLADNARAWDEKGELPDKLIKSMAELGFFGLLIDEKFGGVSANILSLVLILEELARYDSSVALLIAVHNGLVSNYVQLMGLDGQKEKILTEMATGHTLGTWCNGNSLNRLSNNSDVMTVKNENGVWEINGTISHVCFFNKSSYLLMFALDNDKSKNRKLSFIIDRKKFEIDTFKYDKTLGFRSSQFSKINLNAIKLEHNCIIGVEKDCQESGVRLLDLNKILLGAIGIGIARGAMEDAILYSGERKQFGRSINSMQAIQWMLADMATWIDASRLLVYKAAVNIQKNDEYNLEAENVLYSVLKTAYSATRDSIQIHGGYGYIEEYAVEKYYRDAKMLQLISRLD